MKTLVYFGLFMFLSFSIMVAANASCVTTKTVTTYKTSCTKKHYTCGSTCRHYQNWCDYRPCYWDPNPIRFEERYSYSNVDYDSKYACVGMEDPSSCSDMYVHGEE